MVSSTATAEPHTNGHANGNGHINGKDPLGAKIVAAATAVPGVGIKPRSNGAVGEVYKVQERPFETRRPIRVVCMGAGFSGLYLAYRLQQRCENVELVIYEKNHDVGGTWLENTYPGVACDIPAHVYSYSFLPNTTWSQHYAGGSEILDYLRKCADIFKARQYIKFEHRVTSAIWDDETGKWNFKLDNNGQTVEDSADIFINGGGFLNAWKWPEINGLQSFKGTLLHSAQWDNNVEYEGKRVAVIGSGSSAVQIIPNMRPKVAHMDAYIRSSTYVPAPLAEDFLQENHAEGYQGDLKYSEADRKRFATDAEYLKSYRKTIESQLNGFFATFHTGCEENLAFREEAVAYMKKKLQNRPDLVELLIPKWDIGCRRVSPGIGFLEALTKDNVEVVSKEIQEITPEGIIAADGKERKVDIIVCATGFDCSWRPRFTLKGRNGYQIGDKWAEEPRSYMSIAIEEMPNYFIFNGPYNCGGNGCAVPPIEVEGDYMIEAINKIQRQNIKAMVPQMSAIEEFAEHADAIMLRTTWSGTCRNWYRTKSGRVVGTWPGTGLIFQNLMKNPRWEDYDYEYIKFPDSKVNRFSFIGNGYTTDYGVDMAPYLNATPEHVFA